METCLTGRKSPELQTAIDNFMTYLDLEMDRISDKEKAASREEELLTVLPNFKSKLAEISKDALRVHLTGFFRAHKEKFESGIFDIREDNAEILNSRRAYIQEFVTQLLEHASIVHAEKVLKDSEIPLDEMVQRLAQYYSPQWAYDYFFGNMIAIAYFGKKEEWFSSLSPDERNNLLQEAQDIFTLTIRKRFAVSNINPLEAVRRVKKNLEEILTDENMAKELGWSVEDVQKVFVPSIRKHFAVGNINDPLEACKSYSRGEITVPGYGYYKKR